MPCKPGILISFWHFDKRILSSEIGRLWTTMSGREPLWMPHWSVPVLSMSPMIKRSSFEYRRYSLFTYNCWTLRVSSVLLKCQYICEQVHFLIFGGVSLGFIIFCQDTIPDLRKKLVWVCDLHPEELSVSTASFILVVNVPQNDSYPILFHNNDASNYQHLLINGYNVVTMPVGVTSYAGYDGYKALRPEDKWSGEISSLDTVLIHINLWSDMITLGRIQPTGPFAPHQSICMSSAIKACNSDSLFHAWSCAFWSYLLVVVSIYARGRLTTNKISGGSRWWRETHDCNHRLDVARWQVADLAEFSLIHVWSFRVRAPIRL